MVRRWVFVGSIALLATSLFAGVGAAAVGPVADATPVGVSTQTNGTTVEPGTVLGTVPLVTGQTVTVRERGGRRRYDVDASVPMVRTVRHGDTYVYPESVDFDRYDRELFNVDRLLAHSGVGNGTVPVIVKRSSAAAGSVASVGGFEAERTLESIDATAGTVSVDGPATGGALGTSPAVETVYLDREYEVALDNSTAAIDADAARAAYNVSGKGVTVAVLDTGVNESHPDLDEGTEVYEADFTGEGTTADLVGHGTHVAGTVAGDGDASGGRFVGVAPNASIMDLRVLGANGSGTTSGIVAAIETAVKRDADVISMSLGGPAAGDGPLVNASNEAFQRGTLVVAAAGNDGGRGTINTPGVGSDVLTVGAMNDETGAIADFSSLGPTRVTGRLKPDIVAPGVGIASACADAGCAYVRYSGTSMATPHVSGAAALVWAAHPNWTAQRVHDALLTSADPLTEGGRPLGAYKQGAGLLDVDDAIEQDVLIDDATLGFTAVDGSRVTGTVSVTNIGTSERTLNVSATLRNARTGATVGGVTLNRSRVTVDPGETEAVRLTVRTDTGLYSGRLRFAGPDETHTSAFGVAAVQRLTVEKEGINGTSVRGDVVTVVPLSPFDPTKPQRQQSVSKFVLQGRAEFAVSGERALVYSYGTHDFTGVDILTLDVVDLRNRSTVVLNESETVAHTVDTSRLDPRSLTTLVAEPRGQFFVGRGACRATVPVGECYVGIRPSSIDVTGPGLTPKVRYSPHPSLNTSTEFMLVPADQYTPGRGSLRTLDGTTVYDLVFSEAGVEPETYRPDESELGRLAVRYHRTHPSERLDTGITTTPVGLPSQFEFPRYWAIGDRAEQTRYLTPTVSARLWVRSQDFDWDRFSGPMRLSPGESRTVTLGTHPIDPLYGNWSLRGAVPGLAEAPQGRLLVSDRDLRSITTVVRENGSVVRSEDGEFLKYAPDQRPAPGTTYNVTSAYRQRAQNRSTRIVSSLQGVWHRSGDPTPPRIERIDLGTVDRYNRIRTAGAPVTVETAGSVTDLRVAYATAADPSTPLHPSDLRNATDWTTVRTRQTGPNTYRAVVSPAVSTGDLHLIAVATDRQGDTAAHLVERASRIDVDTTGVSVDGVRPLNGTSDSVGARVTLSSDGSTATEALVTASVGGTDIASVVSVPASGPVTEFVSLSGAELSQGTHTVTVSVDGTTERAAVNVSGGAFTMPGSTAASTSVDGDALLEDVDGDGTLDRGDVLAYYEHRDSGVIRDNPARFDFDGDGVAGTVSDALALYENR